MQILFKNQTFTPKQVRKFVNLDESYTKLGQFIEDWVSGSHHFTFHSSGSTGTPKAINITRNQIIASVNATASALSLQPNQTILLCLNPDYIASIMMMARALVLDMDILIIQPCADPLAVIEQKVDFASFVPFQIYQMIESGSISHLNKIKKVLIGGAPLNESGYKQLAQLDTEAYLTYGMTETVSHVALMPIVGDYHQSQYHVLPHIIFGEDEGCLWVQGEVTNGVKIQTNDVVELTSNGTFKWLGRKDYVINSGGVKIHPELVERVIQTAFDQHQISNAFYLTSKADPKLGEILLLMIESTAEVDSIMRIISEPIQSSFTKYHIPREIIYQQEFERTPSGKIKRIKH